MSRKQFLLIQINLIDWAWKPFLNSSEQYDENSICAFEELLRSMTISWNRPIRACVRESSLFLSILIKFLFKKHFLKIYMPMMPKKENFMKNHRFLIEHNELNSLCFWASHSYYSYCHWPCIWTNTQNLSYIVMKEMTIT